eukprot:482734_1
MSTSFTKVLQQKKSHLVFGYIRIFIESQLSSVIVIADVIKSLCMQYLLYIHVQDEWNAETSSKYIMMEPNDLREQKIKGIITTTNWCLAFGQLIADMNFEEVVIWNLAIKSTKFRSRCYCYIGIMSKNMIDLTVHGSEAHKYPLDYGYCGYTGDRGSIFHGRNYILYGVKLKTNDVISVILNQSQRTISFKINNKKYGIAYQNIRKDRYLLAVAIKYKETEVQLLNVVLEQNKL